MFEEEGGLIPVTMVKQFHFCRRIIYFQGVLGYEERSTESMLAGKRRQEEERGREERRRTLLAKRKLKVSRRWFNLTVRSRKLGLIGNIDFAAETNEGPVLIELKDAKLEGRPPPGHLYQSAAYAMLFEEHSGSLVKRIILHYLKNGKTFEFKPTEEIRRHVLWSVAKIKRILSEERLPPYKPTKKCKSCGYKLICRGF